MALNYATTWIGFLGGGVSGSIIGGGSVYQIDLWHMGGDPLPVRVLVTGKRLGIVAEAGTSMAMLIVTGCKSGKDMDGITSSGIDWELALGVKGSALVKTGAKLFKIAAAQAAATLVNWAVHESTKRVAQWAMDDLGIVKSGKQFNLLPYPLGLGIGLGIFYEWQTLTLLGGKIGWKRISPQWQMETSNNNVRLQLFDIPEQDGTKVLLGIAIDEWGLDPYIRWKKKKGSVSIGHSHEYHIIGYAYQGRIFESRDGKGSSGINLTNLQPVGQMEAGWLSTSNTKEVEKNGKFKVYPVVFNFSNFPYWTADDTVEIKVDSDGFFVSASDGSALKD